MAASGGSGKGKRKKTWFIQYDANNKPRTIATPKTRGKARNNNKPL